MVERCCDEGIAFVAKPFDVSDLTGLVTRYAEQARARKEEARSQPDDLESELSE